MIGTTALDLVDRLEAAHQDAKREYLAWAAGRAGLKNGGVGAENNCETAQFIRKHCSHREVCLSLLDEIQTAAEALDDRERYDLLRELFVVHPSLHELWDFEAHAGFHQDQILANRWQGMRQLLGTMSAGGGDAAVRAATVFLAREAIMLENLYSSRLAVSLLDAPLLDEAQLVAEMEEAVATWGSVPVVAFVGKVPAFLSIVRTLLERTGYYGLEWDRVFKKNDWMIGYAPCAVNEGPIFSRKSSLSRLEVLKRVPTLDQASIRDHLRSHFDVSTDDYTKNRENAASENQPLSEVTIMSEQSSPVIGFMLEMMTKSINEEKDNIPEQAAVAAEICRWGQAQGLSFYLSRAKWLQICLPKVGDTFENFIALRPNGKLYIDLYMLMTKKPLNREEMRVNLLQRLNTIVPEPFPLASVNAYPSVSLESIADPSILHGVMGVLGETLSEIQRYRTAP